MREEGTLGYSKVQQSAPMYLHMLYVCRKSCCHTRSVARKRSKRSLTNIKYVSLIGAEFA